jgi:uncharacterized OB-fold protein
MAGLLPELTPENRAFWTGGAVGQLMIARCADCDRRIHPPQLICPSCLSQAVAAEPASGMGTVESWTINHQAWMPGLEVPYALAIVSLDDQPGVRITAQLRDVAFDAVHIGMPVRVDFEPREDVHIPVFMPA